MYRTCENNSCLESHASVGGYDQINVEVGEI